MGKCDIILSQYFEDNCRYADLVNGFVFEGSQVIGENDIMDRNPVMTGFLSKVKNFIPIRKYREKGGKINMCEAIRGIFEDGKMEGKELGLALGDQGRSQTVARNMYARGFTAEEAAGLIGISHAQIQDWYDEWQKEQS